MLFKFTDKANWKDDYWDRLFDLINDFRMEYSLVVSSVGSLHSNKFYFTIQGYSIYFEPNSQGKWLTFQSNTSKADFDEKYEFIRKRIK